MKTHSKKIVNIIIIMVIMFLAFLIFNQYILKGIYRKKEIIGTDKKVIEAFSDNNTNVGNNQTESDPNKGQYIRLSDTLTENSIPYRSESRAGYDKIRINKTNDSGAKISVKMEGAYYSFDYGIWAHATSNIYYDISEYSEKYHYLTVYTGINQTSSSGNGVKFWIYTSNDDTFTTSGTDNWILKNDPDRVVMPGQNAVFEKIDIRGAKYLRLQAYDNGGNGNDHSVWVNPMLITDEYKEDDESGVESIESYDQKIKAYPNKTLSDPKFELLLLQRKFTNNVGNYALKRFLSEDPANKDMLDWLMNDLENLKLYVLGGTPEGGSYYNSLTQLSRLYNEYSSDFTNNEPLKYAPNKTYGYLYKEMAITLSLTHSQRVGLWMQSGATENQSDALKRYAIFKYLHKNEKLKVKDNLDYTIWIENLQVEEMRFIMNNAIDDEEILWLNAYVQTKIDETGGTNWLTPHPHIAYIWPNYGNSVYYAEENKDYFNELFAAKKEKTDKNKTGLFDLKYTIPGGKNNPTYNISITRGTPDYKLYKVWMNFRNKFGTGCVCGGISKSGSNIRATHGIPATVIGQPGHAALLYYTQDAQGRGCWNIDNDVSGWTLSEKGERMLLGWGNASWSRGYSVVYMALAQEAINNYEKFVECEETVMLAASYEGDLEKQEEIYRKALEIQPINIDAWYGLITVYNKSENKTEDQYFELAKELAENLKYFPLPMQHLTNLIKPKLTTIENSYKFTLLQTRILTEGSATPNNTEENYYVYQPSLTRLEANYLLGKLDKTIATFSFDGEDAGKIVLADRFNGNGVRWDYCINGKTGEKASWKEVSFTAEEEHKWQLTPEEIASINAENDIYVHIVGVNYDAENLYKIDITEQGLPSNLYANDLENRVVGVNLTTEWRYTENDAWASYSKVSPDLTGNKKVQIRQAATGTKLTSPASEFYTFTEDNQPDTRKYIPVSHLSKVAVSTEAVNNGGAATNALDANYNTRYHSAWNGTDTERYFTVKLDKPVYLSAVEFVPAGGGNGRIVDGTIWGSVDGEKWEVLTTKTGINYPKQANTIAEAKELTQSFDIAEPKEVQYVKIVADKTNGNWFAARAFNFYQDLTKKPISTVPTASIAYSTTQSTSEPVVARLVSPSTKITITNNGGSDTYIFTENGNFTFEFEDEDGNVGTAEAKVNWIDKKAPTADVEYKLNDDKKLIAILDNISEDVFLLDQNNNKINYIEVNENKKVTNVTYLDNEGKAYKVLDKDANGNTTKITYKNTTNKVPTVATYVTTLKTQEDGNDEIKIGEVIKEEYFDNEGNPVTITDAEKEELRQLQQIARSNPLEYALETSGEYEFKMLDKANNLLYKSLKVDYIDNNTKILASDITYDITNITNKSVVATIKPYMIDVKGNKDVNVEIKNNNGEKSYTFEENDEFTFQYAEVKENEQDTDKEIKEHTAKVNWIDKKAPTAEVKYSTKETTNGIVVATLTNESEPITIINNGANRERIFTENDEFVFKFIDKAGNEGTAIAKVDWITKEPTDYTIGDVNLDGKITATDLLLEKRHLVAGSKQEWILTGDRFKAGDINTDGKITATDLILIKRLVLQNIKTN